MRHARLVVAAGLLVAACALPATAALYKWVDANGRVVYSDQPPSSPEIKAEKLNPAAPPSNPDAVKELAQKDADYRKRVADRNEAATKAGKERADKTRVAEECARAADALRQLGWSQVAIMRTNAKGEVEQLDDAAREKEKARLTAFVKQNCP